MYSSCCFPFINDTSRKKACDICFRHCLSFFIDADDNDKKHLTSSCSRMPSNTFMSNVIVSIFTCKIREHLETVFIT